MAFVLIVILLLIAVIASVGLICAGLWYGIAVVVFGLPMLSWWVFGLIGFVVWALLPKGSS